MLEGVKAFQDPETGETQYYRYIKQIEFNHHDTVKKGKALVLCRTISAIDFEHDSKRYVAKGQGISKEEAELLLHNIYRDIDKAETGKLKYLFFAGTANIYKNQLFQKIEYYNCMSWCDKHLKTIGVKLTSKDFLSFFVADPYRLLPNEKRPNEEISSSHK